VTRRPLSETRPVRRRGLSRDEALDLLPLFAADEAIGAMLLGRGREQEWRQIVTLLEARGFPKIDHLMGGRYIRAVINFFDHQYGLNRDGASPLAPDGAEDFEKWRQRQKRHS
jgi:hypothetical protein